MYIYVCEYADELSLIQTPEDSPWIDSRLEDSADGSRRTFNGSAALSDFEEWMKLMIQTDSSFPKHDAAILLTA